MSKFTAQMQLNSGNLLLCRVTIPHKVYKRGECLGATFYVATDGSLYCATCKSHTTVASLQKVNIERRKF
jgi:hypothetical protein